MEKVCANCGWFDEDPKQRSSDRVHKLFENSTGKDGDCMFSGELPVLAVIGYQRVDKTDSCENFEERPKNPHHSLWRGNL